MESFISEVQVRWSDLDPNVHLRHSVYYDFAASSRIAFLEKFGLTTGTMQRLQIGPILFREECLFKKEIRLNDSVTLDLVLVKARRDFSRWSIRHNIFRNSDTLSAIITVDGAWLDTSLRKLAVPPQEVKDVFSMMPAAPEMEWLS
jgi:acyl-CoA thioester hydrolase